MTSTYLASKPRYEILDGLRGVAALIVVAFHLFETYSRGTDTQILNHGYLAVDFFFILSGFVIGYAYDDRWDRMSLADFFKRRLVRLHPLVVVGTLIGALMFYIGDNPRVPRVGDTPWWQVLLLMLLGMTMLPALKSWDIRGWGETNPLNGPTWSLMWEYVANILYALFIRRLPKAVLGLLVGASAVLTLDICLNIDMFGLLAGREYAANTVIGGWSITAEQGYIGAVRLAFPFLCGLLISRMGRFIGVRGGFWWCSLIISLAFCLPCVPGGVKGDVSCLNGWYNAACILVMFPLVIMLGAGSSIHGKRSVAVCRFLGEISYPLYITHFPWTFVQMQWVSSHRDAPLSQHIFVSVGVYILCVAVAYAVLKLYDEPVRQWLKERFLMKKKA